LQEPAELRALAKHGPREIFGALFAAASETLLELGETRLGARLGVTMVLHTWTRELAFHPHVHALVTAGGLADDGVRWVPSLFSVEVMGALLRGKMLDALRSLYARGAFARLRLPSNAASPRSNARAAQRRRVRPVFALTRRPSPRHRTRQPHLAKCP
jgi:hypothetical protein